MIAASHPLQPFRRRMRRQDNDDGLRQRRDVSVITPAAKPVANLI
jgi:hypothetical protein